MENGPGYVLETYKEQVFFNATLGASYSWSSDDSDLSFTLTGQYYFNGEGYSDPGILDPLTGGAYAQTQINAGKLNPRDVLTNISKHYGSANISISPVKDLSFSVFWLGNFTDFSGLIKPGLSWSATDYISIGLSVPYTYGDAGDEYTLGGDNLSFVLEVSLGRSSF